ncbi:MAG: hypothetical protein V4687_03190 [Bacteroidota bacterium]
MLKRKENTPLTDKYLDSLNGIQSAQPKAFLYERILKRMAEKNTKELATDTWKPLLLVASLAVLLGINLVFYFQYFNKVDKPTASIKDFAAAYDQNLDQQF